MAGKTCLEVKVKAESAAVVSPVEQPRDSSANGSAASSYIHRLPVEVLEHVFEACLPHALPLEPTTDLTSVITTSAPCNISQVCSLWRCVALSLPALWSQWFIALTGATPEMVRKLEGILSTWRDRSKDELLTVFIMVEGKLVTKDGRRELEDTETGIALLALLDFLHKLESRWFRVKFCVYAGRMRIPSKYLDPSKCPNLRELHMTGYPHFNPPKLLSAPQETSVSLSSLRKVVLGDVRMVLKGSLIALQCMRFLRHTPLLETFEVALSSTGADFDVECPVITMNHLKCLVLEVRKQPAENFISKFLLDHLIAPALKTLYIKSRHRIRVSFPSPYVSDFITRSCPPVCYLTLKMEIIEADLISIIRQLPNLTVLHLDEDCRSGAYFLTALLDKEDDSDHALCPRLQTLRFFALPDDVSLALDVLVSRWPSSFTGAARRAALAGWKECTESIKVEVAKEDLAVLDDGWEEMFEKWSAGKGCMMKFGRSYLAEADAKPSSTTGLF